MGVEFIRSPVVYRRQQSYRNLHFPIYIRSARVAHTLGVLTPITRPCVIRDAMPKATTPPFGPPAQRYVAPPFRRIETERRAVGVWLRHPAAGEKRKTAGDSGAKPLGKETVAGSRQGLCPLPGCRRHTAATLRCFFASPTIPDGSCGPPAPGVIDDSRGRLSHTVSRGPLTYMRRRDAIERRPPYPDRTPLPYLCNSSKGKTRRERKIFYPFGHKDLRAVAASRAQRIPARFVQHGPQVEGDRGPRRTSDL
jgi:hypothetical protein